MNPRLQSYLNEHTYPPLLLRHPQLIRVIHTWNLLILQRNHVTRRAVLKLLKNLPPGSVVVDAGCGDGQHIFPYRRRFPALHFWGIDKNAGHIAFCETYSKGFKTGIPPRFCHQNLETMKLENEAEALLSIGILQYIEADERVLKNFYKILKDNGLLVLYTPVNGRSVFPFYRYFFKKMNHYEKRQERKRIYSQEEISTKVKAAGFQIVEKQFTYGQLGIAGHELYALLLMGLGSLGARAWVLLPLLPVLLPLVLVLKWADRILPKKNGNGMLLLAQKAAFPA